MIESGPQAMATRLAALLVVVIVATTLIAGLIVGAQRDDNSGPVDLIIHNAHVYAADDLGSIADATATSFFPAKPLGCYGDGGAVLTDDEGLWQRMDSLRVHGKAVAGDAGADSLAKLRSCLRPWFLRGAQLFHLPRHPDQVAR